MTYATSPLPGTHEMNLKLLIAMPILICFFYFDSSQTTTKAKDSKQCIGQIRSQFANPSFPHG